MEKKEPKRMCVACREMKDKRELLRVVKNAAGEIGIDFSFTRRVCLQECGMRKADEKISAAEQSVFLARKRGDIRKNRIGVRGGT